MKVSFYKALQEKVRIYLSSDLGFVINTFLIWRFLIFFIGVCGFVMFSPDPNSIRTVEFDYGDMWNMWAQWDGWHYIRNSIHGYTLNEPFTAFFPLYPLLIAGVCFILPINPIVAGLLISSLALVGAGYFLIKLVKLDFSEAIAKKSFIFLLVFPSAIFLATVYTEALFLFWIIGAIYFARKGRWFYVFIFSFFASLTRNLGVLLCLPLLIEYIYQYRFKIKKEILAISGPALGLASYMTYLWIQFGDPLRFLADQAAWGRVIKLNIFANYKDIFWYFVTFPNHRNPIVFFEFGLVVLTTVLMVIAFTSKKIRKSYAVLMLLLMLPPVMQNSWASTNRYMLVIFPSYILLAIFAEKYKYLGQLLMIGFTLCLALHTALFVNFMWAG